MALYPFTPQPASVHVPTVLDPAHRFSVDQGYELRRSVHSRARRIFQLDYLGRISHDMRFIRDFLQEHRLSVTPFQWANLNSVDTVAYSNTTPVVLTLSAHMYRTGQFVGVSNAAHAGLNGFWGVTRLAFNQIALNGTTAGGTGTCSVFAYLPYAIGRFANDTLESSTKLMGPDSLDGIRGRFSWQVFIEEVF